jgi:hypothetical protein
VGKLYHVRKALRLAGVSALDHDRLGLPKPRRSVSGCRLVHRWNVSAARRQELVFPTSRL